MPINYDELMQAKSTGIESTYTDRETMLYALGVGFMRDPMNADELPFAYENGLKTVPTMATVIGWGQSSTMARSGINYLMVVHGEQRITMHKPLPTAATVVADERVLGVFDKGKDKGAVLVTERVMREKKSGDKLCTLVSTTFARAATAASADRRTARPSRIKSPRARRTSCMPATRAPTRRSSTRCRATAIRCTAIPPWRRWPVSRVPSCTGFALMERPAARSSPRCANTIRRRSPSSTCASPRPCSPARRS